MNLTALSLKELEAEAHKNPTPELIVEVSKRTWEAQGKCVHGAGVTIDSSGACAILTHCYKCKTSHWTDIPDITKPENFWPLVELIHDAGATVTFTPSNVTVTHNNQIILDLVAINKMRGIAVAIAYLRIMEEKNGI